MSGENGNGRGNLNAVRHGATSQLVRRNATVEKRRLLRKLGVRESELESLGPALVGNWARCAAALFLLDRYAQEHGWLDADGQPLGFTRLYTTLLNSELRALRALESYLRKRDDGDELVERLYQGLADR